MRNHFNTYFLILVALVSITSCQQDDQLTQEKEEAVFTTKVLTGDKLSNNTQLQEAFQKAKGHLNTSFITKSTVYDSINGFWIDESKVHYVSSGEYESYTYAVIDSLDSSGKLNNLMLHKRSDGTFLPVLFTYDIDNNNLNNSTIEYKVLEKSTASIRQKSNITDFVIQNLNPCGWDNSDCACWRLDGNTIFIDMNQDECQIFEAPTEAYDEVSISDPSSGTPGGGTSGGAGSGSGSGSDGGFESSGGFGSGSFGGSGSGYSGNLNQGPIDDATAGDCLALSNGDCFGGAVTLPVLEILTPVDGDTQNFFDTLSSELQEFLNDASNSDAQRVRAEVNQFLIDNGNTQENKDLAEEFLEIAIKSPKIKLERYKELIKLIENDPWVLLKERAQQNGLDTTDFINLYNHTIPQSCIDRLNNLGPGFNNQPIDQGNVPLANIDYYLLLPELRFTVVQ
ncbi:MAG: hypothetical protein AAF901_08705 [Bacteroidota bacterium]